ncbi:MAG: hypothetical protein P8013_15400 [Candidatus Sulfobium sp.]
MAKSVPGKKNTKGRANIMPPGGRLDKPSRKGDWFTLKQRMMISPLTTIT